MYEVIMDGNELVSVLRARARHYDIGIVTIADLNNKKLESYINKIDNAELRSNIEKTIIENSPLIARRFKKFIIDNIEEVFWSAQGRPVLGRINREDLPYLLGRIYDQRSKTLHNAEPFPRARARCSNAWYKISVLIFNKNRMRFHS